jgi:hypothetical protein
VERSGMFGKSSLLYPYDHFLRTYIDDDVQSGKHETCMKSLMVIYEDQHNDKDLSLPSHYCHCLDSAIVSFNVLLVSTGLSVAYAENELLDHSCWPVQISESSARLGSHPDHLEGTSRLRLYCCMTYAYAANHRSHLSPADTATAPPPIASAPNLVNQLHRPQNLADEW